MVGKTSQLSGPDTGNGRWTARERMADIWVWPRMEVWPEGGGEGGRGILSVVFLWRINVTMLSVHTRKQQEQSPLASLAGYKPAVTQPLYMCLFIIAFSQHAFKSEERGHHIFHGLINVHRYELLLMKHQLQVRSTGLHVCSWESFSMPVGAEDIEVLQ